ncbi:hypothetical protein [uncultured Methanobrevibacter sp.]|uniref:hypothetical protein n=1 Tax=uncultured Methanobrevibacter sp. TaxID=253161 RepID=UPI0025F92974|nr:hypothetical protein [uncultured Methanobrevibacter sp.]
MKNLKMLIIPLILFLTMASISAHGVDVTADTMVVANETNGQLVKDIADANGKNISVYKFTSQDEVAHILEHSINNTNKKILLVAYQDTGNDFLKNHKDLSNRIIVVDNVTNDTILQGLNNIMNTPAANTQSENSFGLPLAIGIAIGLIIGVGCGILILKKKE